LLSKHIKTIYFWDNLGVKFGIVPFMKKVLHVEDDPVNAILMAKLLGMEFQVTQVEDGESCLSLIDQEQFDVILMDVNLGRGRMNGTDTLKKIKEKPEYRAVPVIAITSYSFPEDEDQLLNEGFDDYFAKPVEFAKLIDRINQYID
jgi:two-component system, cell cycle response regulator DivK